MKYTQQTYHDKLSKIIDDFPRLEEIHPFYGDLLNVLYDKDHYKLALGQVNPNTYSLSSGLAFWTVFVITWRFSSSLLPSPLLLSLRSSTLRDQRSSAFSLRSSVPRWAVLFMM